MGRVCDAGLRSKQDWSKGFHCLILISPFVTISVSKERERYQKSPNCL